MQEVKTRRSMSGKARQQKMPRVIELAVHLIKAEERKALLQAINNPDPVKAELARVTAANMDRAASIVLFAFDEITRNPGL